MRLHRLDDQVPGNAVEELLHVQVNDPGVALAAFPAGPDRVQRPTARPVPVRVSVDHRFRLRLDPGRDHRLRDTIRDRGDMRFILLSFPGAVRLGL